jgi:hypothetical protein
MKTLDLTTNYRARLHPSIWILVLVFFAVVGASGYSLYLGFYHADYISGTIKPWERGDFWGGHIAAITGSITLLVVIISTAAQARADHAARLRDSFLQGIGHIATYDIEKAGCEQALRLLDYYSMLANQIRDPELYLILNTVMTGQIRKTLEEIDADKKKEIYPNAREARRKIQELLKAHYKATKGYEEEIP